MRWLSARKNSIRGRIIIIKKKRLMPDLLVLYSLTFIIKKIRIVHTRLYVKRREGERERRA